MLRWMERNTRPVSTLASATVRGVLEAFATKLDNRPSAATVVNRKRAVLSNALEHAVEPGLLASNPVAVIKWKTPRTSTSLTGAPWSTRCKPAPCSRRCKVSSAVARA